MPDPILEINDLHVCFRGTGKPVTAVDNISFSVWKGKTVGIVGESGSGKSVTALSILRLLPGQAEMTCGGMLFREADGVRLDLSSCEEKQMRTIRGRRISMIFQEPMTSLNPVMRCGQQVAEAIRAHERVSAKTAMERVVQLFSEVQLPRPDVTARSYPHELSGGQKQRIMIAMAIACRPAILIADEPTTSLDVTLQQAILKLIKELQEKYGMAVIFITHDLGLVRHIADDILVMKNGQAVESGPVQKVYSRPEHPYTRGLLACRPPTKLRPFRLPTVKDFLEQESISRTDRYVTKKGNREPDDHPQNKRKICSDAPLLSVSGLKTWFPVRRRNLLAKKDHFRAVDGVSFEVYAGETVGLVGESGCGKTTLGRSILRLIEPSGGRIIYGGAGLIGISHASMKKMRKKMQIIFQDPFSSLNPRMTAGRAIMEPMMVHGLNGSHRARKEHALMLMEKVGLEKAHFDRYPHELSGGQRQRVCIARALAVNPDFIICDESVSALDVSVQATVLNLLNDLKTELGLTYLFISHDLSVVKYMSDRIIVMKDGNIEESGEADAVYRHPKSSYTKKLIEAIPK